LDLLLAEIDNKFADVDLLANSAGVFFPKAFLEHTEKNYDRYMKLNKGTFFITQHVARKMVTRGQGGAIVNIGSMWAKQAVQATPSSAYSMAKAGLHFLIQHLAMELASAKVREASTFGREPATKTASAQFLSRLDVSSKAGRSRDQ